MGIETRRWFISKCGMGLAGIIAAGKAPAAIVRSMVGATGAKYVESAGGWKNPYVTNGLIAMWDGEWNAGLGIHDQNAVVWKDLSGKYDLVMSGTTVNDDHVTFNKGSIAENYGTISFPYATIEGVVKITSYGTSPNLFSTGDTIRMRGLSSGVGYRALMNAPVYGNFYGIRLDTLLNIVFNFAFVFQHDTNINTKCTLYQNSGKPTKTQWITAGWRDGMVDHIYMSAPQAPWEVYSLRYYNRALTAEEVLKNYSIDKERFGL